MIRCILILWVCLCGNIVLGQEIVQFKKIDKKDGLSSGRVTSIIQDNQGFIWIGTKSGLNRYDGHGFRLYNQYNSTLSASDISDLLLDSRGMIWIATVGGGLNVYDSLKDTFFSYQHAADDPSSLSSNEIHTILEDTNGNIWIGGEAGLNELDLNEKVFKRYSTEENNPKSLSHNGVWSLAIDYNTDLWIGTYGGGINKFDRKSQTFSSGPQLVGQENLSRLEFVNAITPISSNQLLIGTHGQGLVKLNTTTKKVSNVLETYSNKDSQIIRDISLAANGNIWIGTDGEGIIQIQNLLTERPIVNQFINDNKLSYSLSNNTVNTIFEDRESNIWIGTAWKGVNVIENKQSGFSFLFSDIIGYEPFPVLSIFEQNQKLWIGTDGRGLNVYDIQNGSLQKYDKINESSLGGDYIQFVKDSGNGKYWIGTFANGLVLFDYISGESKRFKNEPGNPNSIPFNDIRDIAIDDSGNLWGATWGGGLFFFDVQSWKFKSFKNDKTNSASLSNDNIVSIEGRNDGKIWIATFGGGLNLFDPETSKFKNFQHINGDHSSLLSDYIFSLLCDDDNNLWIGTRDGLCLYDAETGKFRSFEYSDDSKNKSVVSILSDFDQNIWFGTKQGIFKFDRKSSDFQTFYELSGEYHINSAFKNEQGELYFGGIEGVVIIDPSKQINSILRPKVNLTNLKLFNKEVEIDVKGPIQKQILYEEMIHLKHDQDVISFEFAALKYPFSSHLEYAIKMENFDNDWREIGNQRSATYTNLPSGDYNFKVKVKESNNKWSDTYTSVQLEVLSPFWATWWAYLFYVLIIVFLLYWYQKYSVAWVKMKSNLKLEQLTRENETELFDLKQRFFTNISHEIRTPVTLILGALNQFQEKEVINKWQKEAVDVLKRNGDHLLHLVNELLDFRKLESSKVDLEVTETDFMEFTKEIYLSFKAQAKESNMTYEFESKNDVIKVWFDSSRMEKVIYNLLSNAFKYTKSGDSIRVILDANDNNAYLSVSDTGKGISQSKLQKIFHRFYQTDNTSIDESGFGLGLSIAREVVELHSGQIYAESKKGVGTTFSVKLLLGNDHFKSNEIKIGSSSSKENIETDNELSFQNSPQEIGQTESTSVLIVEDNDGIRDYLNKLLKSNFQVSEAVNGKQGLEIALKDIPDLIISDVMMPEMDGIQMTEKLKSDVRTSHIPVILLTARTSLIYKNEGFETGADDYITKPFNEVLLKTRIKNLLKSRVLLRNKFKTDAIIEPKELPLNSPDEEFLSELIQLLENNIGDGELKADFFAKELGMSHSVIYKKVKALTGQSLVEFVREFRLKRAAHLIREHENSVIEACYKVGFSDRKYFGQIFKKKYGVSPTAYVKTNHK